MKINILLCTTVLFTVLYPHAPLQAQIKTKTFSYTPKTKASEEKPALYIKKENNGDVQSSGENDHISEEIDRIFEKYKALSDAQDKAANDRPMKNKTSSIEKQEPEKQEKAGFAGILEQYQKSKENKAKTKSMRFTQPRNMNN